MIVWRSNKLEISIFLMPSVIDHLLANRQLRWLDCEAGGPLFSEDPGKALEIVGAAGPFPRDRRKRQTMVPHRPSVQKEITDRHIQGQHFVGTWHTHTSTKLNASGLDMLTMANLYRESVHQLDMLVMIIVGAEPCFTKFQISAHGTFGSTILHPKLVATD